MIPGRISCDFGGPAITPSRTTKTLDADAADLIAFGKAFISNPDLVERLKRGAGPCPVARVGLREGRALGVGHPVVAVEADPDAPLPVPGPNAPVAHRVHDRLRARRRHADAGAVPVDAVNTMGIPADDAYAKFGEPPAWAEFRAIAKEAGVAATIEPISKWDFYKHVESPDHVLTIQTGDQALWANVLLTLGCRTN